MKTIFLVAHSGEFIATKEEIEKIINSEKGLEWDLSLDDGSPDPLYCKSLLKIIKFEQAPPTKKYPKRKTHIIEGTIIYNKEPRTFQGRSKPAGRFYRPGTLRHYFTFTKPAAPLNIKDKKELKQKGLTLLGL